MANNKVQLADGTVLIDLTDTTATADDVAEGKYFYSSAGVKLTGTGKNISSSGGTIYQDLEGNIHLSEDDATVIKIVDTLDENGGVIRTITSEVQSDTIEVYTSSTGLLYTAKMTIDLSMERTNGYQIADVFGRYGSMPYLRELTLTGTVRNNAANQTIAVENQFSSENYPALKKLHIEPTTVLNLNGAEYDSSATQYNNISAGHYAFNATNLTELTLGKLGGPYWRGGGYFRKDFPVPPGISKNNVGSEDGMTLKVYVASYRSPAAGFMEALAPNTTVIQYDYLTGEVLTG